MLKLVTSTRITLLVWLFVTLFTTACSKYKAPSRAGVGYPPVPTGTNPTPVPNPNPNPDPAPNPNPSQPTPDALTGTWNSSCIPTDTINNDPADATAKIVTWQFSNNTDLYESVRYFTASDCSSGELSPGTFSGSYTTSDSGSGSYQNLDYDLNGQPYYQIYSTDGTYLYLGDYTSGLDSTSPENRPNTLFSSPTFVKSN